MVKMQEVDINALVPAEYNPRQANEKEYANLKESISRFGLVDPIIVNSAENRKNIIIGGHFRVKVAQDMGITKAPVVYIEIPEEDRERELNLRLNKNLGSWDIDGLANFNDDLLEAVGFDLDEILRDKDEDDKPNLKKDNWLWFECKDNEQLEFVRSILGTNHKRKINDVRLMDILRKIKELEK